MRNQEAARYARWAAFTAGVIAMGALGIYAKRAIRQARARAANTISIPASVQQQSAQFSFSKVEQDRTIFTIRASQATQFRDQDRAVLKDVWISIYGAKGERNDSIHTGECSYEPKTGNVRCEGDVEIDIQAASAAGDKTAADSSEKKMKVTTRDLTFNRETGEAHTDQPVNYQLPQGSGRAVGVTYSSKDATVRLEHNVELEMSGSERTGGLPVTAQGSSLEIRRNDLLVVLAGPATVTQGNRELTAGTITFEMDNDYHVRHAIAMENPAIEVKENGAEFHVTADQFEGYLSAAGWIERLAASGNVQGTRKAAGATDLFSSTQVNITMLPEKNLIEQMTATGKVKIDSRGPDGTRKIETEALEVSFSTEAANGQAEHQQVTSAESTAPATIETISTTNGREKTDLAADRFQAVFGKDGKFEKLLGHANVRITRQIGSALPQVSSAQEMEAEFAKGGEWEELLQTGHVKFQQGDRGASAERAKIVRSTDLIDLEGSPILTDAQSRTTADKVSINQKTGEVKATGGIVTTIEDSGQNNSVGLGSGAAHVSAATLSGSTTSGHVIYSGRARLWQGESVLDAEQIEVWREEQKLKATGNVVAVFPQAAGSSATPASGASVQSVAQKKPEQSKPTLWTINAPVLTYWGQEGKAHLEGGVTARSEEGTIRSKAMDVYFASAGGTGSASTNGAAGPSRQFTRAVAMGGVVVTQGDRKGVGEEADYTSADGKFVLSGGKPTVSDGSGNTTVGRSLTFFEANDTILIDSEEGSRTLTKHRVEK